MTQIDLKTLKIGDKVLYVPCHLDSKPENAEEGYVTGISGCRIWVRYKGPQGNLTPQDRLFKG